MSDSPTGYDARTDDPDSIIGGGLGVVNPGTGPVPGARKKHAHTNIAQLAEDVSKQSGKTVLWSTDREHDDPADGRWGFKLIANGRECEIEMPGLKLESVRYLGREHGHNIWHYPRLYVDGSSWVWKFAVDAAERYLFEEEDA